MPDPQEYKEVYFHKYCKTCKRSEVKSVTDPNWAMCNECMSHPINFASHKPVKYEKATKKKGD